jgi:23S rRNA G2445 N2-methylase RlmL
MGMEHMNGAAVTIVGFEDVCKKEIESFGAKCGKIENGFVIFEVKDALMLAKIAYKTQTASRVLLLLGETKISKNLTDTEKHLESLVKDIDFPLWIDEAKTFKVECERTGEHEFTSSTFESMLGRIIIQKIRDEKGYTPKVAMDNPDLIIFSNIRDDTCILGVDFCGFDMSKRDYHIFINKVAIKGTVAACLSLFADIKPKKTVLDTFSSSGTIAIETAFISNGLSPNRLRKEEFVFKRLEILRDINWNDFFGCLDKPVKSRGIKIIATDPLLANVRQTAKNAKIAGVHKEIASSRIDIEWLDTKIKKSSVDAVITKLPSVSRSMNEKDIGKLYKEFFYQLEYILKKGGKVVILIINECLMVKLAKEYKFEVTANKDIMIGKLRVKVVSLKYRRGE